MEIKLNPTTFCIAAIALACLPVSVSALQSAPMPFDASGLEAHHATYTYVIIDGQGNERAGGSWTDTVTIDDANLTRTVIRYGEDGEADLQRTIVADRVSLLPITLDQRFGAEMEGVLHVDYSEASIDQFYLSSATSAMRQINVELTQPVWELSLWGTLAMSLPLDQSASHAVSTLASDRRSLRDVTFEVGHEETIELSGEIILTRRVHIPEVGWTFWIRDTSPYLVRIEHPISDEAFARSILQSTSVED